MEFDEVLKTRRSIRKYKPVPVPEKHLYELIEAARLAPSALNLQPWRYVIIKESSVIKKIAMYSPNSFIADSPALIICCLDTKAFDSIPDILKKAIGSGEALLSSGYEPILEHKSRDEAYINTLLHLNAGISYENILLKAADLGLGACWIGMLDADSIKKLVGIDDRYIIPALISIGYPDQQPSEKPKLPVGQLLLKTI